MKNKKGVSLMISYVLLVVISVSLSVLVYNWLYHYLDSKPLPECSEDTVLIIQDYECLDGFLNITLKNKGLFSLDGFILKVNDREGAHLGIYTVDNVGKSLSPTEKINLEYDLSSVGDHRLEKITLIEVQPFVNEEGKVYCSHISSQELSC